MFSCSKFQHSNAEIYRYREPISKEYDVIVNGEEIPVYTARISKIPFNRAWPGYQRAIEQTQQVSFVNIVSEEAVTITVRPKRSYQNFHIRPYSKQISFTDNDGEINFSLENEGQYILCGDDLQHCLYLFVTKPITCENPNEVTHYFGPGIHTPGKITLNDNESVYVDKDALVFGCIYAKNAKNIRIFGNGLLDDSGEERFSIECYADYTNGNLKFYDCENVTVEGVLLRNSAIWCVNLFHCNNVFIDNIKIFGQWRYNTDGIDIVNSQNITIQNSLVHSFDDSITIKGIDRYIEADNKNIVTENCVLWCDWGKTCEIGLETACRTYQKIIFRNCDIIRAGNTALDIQNGDCAEVFDVLFENINVEYNSYDNVPVYQENDDFQYNAYGEVFVPHLISILNNRFRSEFYCNDIWGIPPKHSPVDLKGIDQANVHDIIIRNIHVYYDEKIEKKDGKFNVPIAITSLLDDVEFYNITVENIVVNGIRLTKENALFPALNVKNFQFR